MKNKSGHLDSPMQHCMTHPKINGSAGVYDHHITKQFSKPRDGGKDLPEKFFSILGGTPAPMNTPMSKGQK